MEEGKNIITKISTQKRKNRVNIYVDGEFFAGVDNDVLLKYNLYKGKEVDREELNAILEEEEKLKGWNYALNLISYRMRAEREMRDRLKKKGYNEDVIEKIIERLKELELIDDEKFAEMWVKERVKTHPRSNFVLIQELRKKGIDSGLAERIVEKIVDNDMRHRMIEELIEKIKRRYKNEDRNKRRRLILSYLSRRGFSYEEIIQHKID